jgi:hypothetical protein
MARSLYPEHEKLKAVQHESQKCGEFFEWLQSEKSIAMECHYDYERDEEGDKVWRDTKGRIVKDYTDPDGDIFLTTARRKRLEKTKANRQPDCRLVLKPGGPITMPIRQRLSQLLAEFFEIDEDKLEEEKRAMLDACRAAHEEGNDDSGVS